MSRDEIDKTLALAREKMRLAALEEEKDDEVIQAHSQRVAAIRGARDEHQREVVGLRAQVDTLKDALQMALSRPNATAPASARDQSISSSPAARTAVLKVVIDGYLAAYPKAQKPQMWKKTQPALALLTDLHGGKQIAELKMADLVDYFNVVEALPPRWSEKCRKLNMSVRELAKEEHPTALNQKTFTDNYLVPVRLFLARAKLLWQDEGFPALLSVEGIEFSGEPDQGRRRQRALRQEELRRLFREVLAPYQNDQTQDHRWWLPVLAFYTGGRVNELAQLTPVVDIGWSEGINFILVTEDTEADEGVRKSVKTGRRRHVPLHPDLIHGGFLDYVARIKKQGSKRLFPAWKPTKGRASIQAERWFRDLLRDNGLRDETPGARVVGFHAFRHTLLTQAANSLPPVDAGPITGHSDATKSAVQREYEGELPLKNKLALLTAVQFGFKP